MLKKWKLPFFLLVVLAYLQYSFWFGKNNFFDYQNNKNVVKEMQTTNKNLKLRNEQMFAEINDLYNGSEAIEERARNLGMIKPNEYFFRIIHDSQE